MVKDGLENGVPGINVVVNPEKVCALNTKFLFKSKMYCFSWAFCREA